MKFALTISILLISQCLYAQRSVQELFVSWSNNHSNSEWFSAYRNANYLRAFKIIEGQKITPPKAQFVNNSLLYANQKGNVDNNSLNIWAFNFYKNYQNPTVNFNNNRIVELPIERNLFEAVIGSDTLRVVIDTGGSGISVAKEIVEKYNFPTDTTIKGTSYMPAFNRTSIENPTIIDQIFFGEIELTNLRAKFTTKVIDSGQYSSNQQYDIFMGIDVLIGLINHIRFDWIRNQVIFSNQPFKMDMAEPFFFFNSKPLTVVNLNNTPLTALIDTGSPVDIMNNELYKDSFTNKEVKQYGEFSYNQYSIPIDIGSFVFELAVADYMEGFNLVLDGEIIDLIIGTNHNQLTLDLQNNLFELK